MCANYLNNLNIVSFAIVKSVILDFKSILMKQLFSILLIAAFLGGCAGKSTGTDNTTDANTSVVANKTVTLAIEGMTCTGCENTIQEAVTKVAGIATIKASHLDSTAVVSFDTTQTSVTAIGDVITEAGYVFKGEKLQSIPAGTK
jgi:mercuric ion binding protein